MCEAIVLAILIVLVLMIVTAYMMGWMTRNRGYNPLTGKRIPKKIHIHVSNGKCSKCGANPCKCMSMPEILSMPADSFCYQCDGPPFELMPKWGGPCQALPGGTCGNYMPDQMCGPETERMDGSARFGDNQNLEFMCGSCTLPNCYYEHLTPGPKDRSKFYYLTGTPDTMLFNNL